MLEIKNLCVSRGGKPILSGIDLAPEPKAMTAVLGKNGCGKSTLVSCVNRELPFDGEILLNGKSIRKMSPKERARFVSFLPQKLPAPHISVEELVGMGRNPYLGIGKRLTAGDRLRVRSAMEAVGIASLSDCFADEISGGERQKAYLAMTVVQDTGLMIFDEPTTYMDVTGACAFMKLLDGLKKNCGKTVLAVMHDLGQAVRWADNVAVISEKKLFFYGSVEKCLEERVIETVFGVNRHEADGEVFFSAE